MNLDSKKESIQKSGFRIQCLKWILNRRLRKILNRTSSTWCALTPESRHLIEIKRHWRNQQQHINIAPSTVKNLSSWIWRHPMQKWSLIPQGKVHNSQCNESWASVGVLREKIVVDGVSGRSVGRSKETIDVIGGALALSLFLSLLCPKDGLGSITKNAIVGYEAGFLFDTQIRNWAPNYEFGLPSSRPWICPIACPILDLPLGAYRNLISDHFRELVGIGI